MIWESPAYLWLLVLVPMLYGLQVYLSRNAKKRTLGVFSADLYHRLAARSSDSRRRVREALLAGSFFFLIVALAGPSIGTEVREVRREQLDLMVALDLSLSMQAEDVRPNRLEKAKFEINRIVDALRNDRIGLVVFTGQALLQCPLTRDYNAFRMYLDIADPDLMPSTTTDFAPLFRQVARSFTSAAATGTNNRAQEAPARLLVVFSDGEDHFDRYDDALQELVDMGVHIYTVGIGTEQGGYIPIRDAQTGAFYDYHRDFRRQIVTTRLEPQTLQAIAAASGGEYVQISRTAHGIDRFINQLQHMERSAFATMQVTRYSNRYSVAASASLGCLLLYIFLPLYRRPQAPIPSPGASQV